MADRKRIRILWLIKGLGPGGAERLLVSTARQSDQDRITYETAYVLTWKDHLVDELAAEGVVTHPLGVQQASDLRWIWQLWRLLRNGRFDVVHGHSPVVTAVARVLVRALPRPQRPAFISTEHNVWTSYRRPSRLVNRMTAGLDDHRITVSEQVRRSLPRSLRTQAEVIVQGLLIEDVNEARRRRDAIRRELGAREDEILVVTIANLRPQKGYPHLLAAAKQVLDRELPVRFAAAGQGPLETDLRDLHARLGLGDRFRLMGYRDDPLAVVAAGDVFVLASLYEGYPIALMEALSIGVPVIATAVGGACDAITHGINGFLVEPGDPEQLASAIIRVAEDRAMLGRMTAAVQRVGSRYDIRQTVERTESLYRRLARHGPTDGPRD